MSTPRIGRVDLHLHSYASNVTSYYAANAFSIPESYSDPLKLYAVLKHRGMDLVTLTDHNSIDGGKMLLDRGYEDVFLSSELTCRFRDGCHVHVTVANVTERQFDECNRLRHDIIELVDYLESEVASEVTSPDSNKIAWFMTHPLMSTENRAYGREGSLTVEHLELALLLIPGFEVRNGSRTRALNDLTHDWLNSLTPARMADLAERFGLQPRSTTPWLKFHTGGSDDHAGINPGRTWTTFEYQGAQASANDLVAAMRAGRTKAEGAHGGPITLAHSILKLLHDGTKQNRRSRSVQSLGRRRPPAKTIGLSGPAETLMHMVFDGDSNYAMRRLMFIARGMLRRVLRSWGKADSSFERVLEAEIYRLLGEQECRERLRDPQLSTDDRIFFVVSTLINRIFARYLDNLRLESEGNVVGAIKEFVSLVASNLFVSLPYLASFLTQSSDSMVSSDLRKRYAIAQPHRLVLLTDTFFDVNGVAATIKRMLRESRKRGVDFTVVTCVEPAMKKHYLEDPETRRWVEDGTLKLFDAIVSRPFPEYADLRLNIPPFLEVLRYLQESGFSKVHISTPGPVGLTGLAAAKLLQLETASTYHTSVPEYVENYTRDISLEHLAWKYMVVFYHAVDEVLVPSRYIAKLLHKRGLRNRKLLILDRWVDCDRFTPEKKVPHYWLSRGIANEAEVVKFVYVGRLGIEKNLSLLAEAFRLLCAWRSDAHLVIIGDGPFRSALEELLAGLPVTWTGFLDGDELPRAVASSDVKLFPSVTDTWGNAPLEGQACGLPVIVSEVGGPVELMRDGVTGLCVSGRNAAELAGAMEILMESGVRSEMGKAARRFCLDNRIDEPYLAVFDSEKYRKRIVEADSAPSQVAAPVSVQAFDLSSRTFETFVREDERLGATA